MRILWRCFPRSKGSWLIQVAGHGVSAAWQKVRMIFRAGLEDLRTARMERTSAGNVFQIRRLPWKHGKTSTGGGQLRQRFKQALRVGMARPLKNFRGLSYFHDF